MHSVPECPPMADAFLSRGVLADEGNGYNGLERQTRAHQLMKTWMPGIEPGMTVERPGTVSRHFRSSPGQQGPREWSPWIPACAGMNGEIWQLAQTLTRHGRARPELSPQPHGPA